MIWTLLLAAALLVPALGQAPTDAPAPAPIVAPGSPLAASLVPLTEDRLFRESVVGFQVVKASSGEEIFAWQPDHAMMPASVMKLLTSATALRTLGPSWRFGTDLLHDGEITAEGVLKGNLYVRGGGDPTLVVEKLWRMIADLKLAGVLAIEGNIVFDDSYFSDDYLITGWDKEVDVTNGPAYFPTIGALSVNYNTACLVIAPGPAVGQPARVQLDTPASVIEIDNQMTTGRAGSRRWTRIDRELLEDQITIKFTLKGNIPLDAELDRSYRAIAAPLPHFISVFRNTLAASDLKVKGRFIEGVTPKEAVRLVHMDSPPLAVILADMNKSSSNFMAEQVLRTLGAQLRGAPGDTAKGVSVVQDYLRQLGLPVDTYRLVNGSGLSREILLPPSAITAVLLDMYHDRKVGPEFTSSLAIGGVDGTLWARFRDEGEVGRVRGKTGSLNGVYCLAGYIDAADGEVYAFAMLVNEIGSSSWPVRRLHERFAEAMLATSAVSTPEQAPQEAEEPSP